MNERAKRLLRDAGSERTSVLLVEDSASDRRLLLDAMENFATVRAVAKLQDALALLDAEEADVVLLDLHLPDAYGLEGLIRLRERHPQLPVVVLTGGELDVALDALAEGAQDFLSKDEIDPLRLARAIAFALERQQLREQLESRADDAARSAEELEGVLEVAADALLLLDVASLRIVWANEAARALFRAEAETSILGRRPLTASMLERARSGEVEVQANVNGGDKRDLALRATRTRFRGVPVWYASLRDAESRRETEEAERRLVRGERLLALGQMAASVSHEINNPIAYVLANLQTLQRAMRAGSQWDRDADEMLDDALTGSQRVASIVSDLQTFARVRDEAVTRVHLDVVARAALNLLSSRVRKSRAKVQMELPEVAPISAFEGRLIQVASNLVANALDALEESGGTVTVRTTEDEAGVCLIVEDDGPGMSEETRQRVFTPFFTTKGSRGGMGLGLSVCAEIADRHGGTLALDSQLAQGTRVTLRLPRATGLEAERPAPTHSGTRARVRGGRILLIDDEELVRRGYRRMLGRRFEIETAASGPDALALLARDERFDLVLCDVEMPEMDGPSVLEAIERLHPDLAPRFVFCTGGVFTEASVHALAQRSVPTVAKPLDLATVRDLVHRFSSDEAAEG